MNEPFSVFRSVEMQQRAKIEDEYRRWCSDHGYDPEDVGSAVEYEEWYRECVLPEEPQPGYIN